MTHDIVEAPVSVYLVLHRDAILDLLKVLMEDPHILNIAVRRTRLAPLLERNRVVFVEVKTLNRALQDLDDLLASVFFIFRTTWSWLKILIVKLTVDLRQVCVLALWNTNYLLRSIQRIASVTEEYIESTVIEDDDELVRVGALSHRFEPADVLDLALLLSCSEVVIFDDHALVLEDGIVAAYHACLCSKEEFELGLVLGVLTTILC